MVRVGTVRRGREEIMQVSQGVRPERLGALENNSDESNDPASGHSEANALIVPVAEKTCNMSQRPLLSPYFQPLFKLGPIYPIIKVAAHLPEEKTTLAGGHCGFRHDSGRVTGSFV